MHNEDNPWCHCPTCLLGYDNDDNNEESMRADAPWAFFVMDQSRKNQLTLPNNKPIKPLAKPLDVRVAADIEQLFEGVTLGEEEAHKEGKELPDPNYDLTSYKDAYEYALKMCMHNTVKGDNYNPYEPPNNILCQDCNKFMTVAQFEADRKRVTYKLREQQRNKRR